ncbi:MAG: immune inhibitor A, partial [Thermoplasmata archaeon]
FTDATFERLWNRGAGSGTLTISRTLTGENEINTFNGMQVNQRWRLYALDVVTGSTGFIDYWWIKVHYTNDRVYDSYMTSYMKQPIDLSGHTDCNLSFHFWLDAEHGYDYLELRASTIDYANPLAAGWTSLRKYLNGFDSQEMTSTSHSKWWSSGNIDISAFDGQTVYILFLFYGDVTEEREGAYVDNIKVTGNGKSYANDMDTYAETTVDLSGYDNAYLNFVYWLDAEDYFDIFNVSVKRSTDTSWTPILTLNDGYDYWQYDGADPDIMAREWWYTGHLSLDAFCGDSAVKIRFWFKSDDIVTREGMYIDEVEIASIFFFDDMESGAGEWFTYPEQSEWHLVTNRSYSPTHSWWCGNGTTYSNSTDEYLIHSFDLRTAEAATLRFLLTGHLQPGDYFFIGISMDDGENWHYYGGLNGTYAGWWQFEITNLTMYLHKECLVAFNLYTDKEGTSIGYWIDDVTIYGTRDRTPPGQVINLGVESGVEGDSLALVWNANPEIDLSHYRVYRSFASGGPYEFLANASTNSYLDEGLIGETEYFYVVSALDFASNEGPASAEASGITNDTMPPAPVLDVTATDLQTGGKVNVSWLPNNEKDLAGYKIYYSTADFSDASSATYYPLSPVDDAGAVFWEIYGLENNVQYHFAVTAIDKNGNENTSIEKTAIATPTDQTPPLIFIEHPADLSTVNGTVDITVAAGDSSGLAGVWIYINKGDPVNATYDHFLRKWVYQWNTASVPDGEVTIDAEASDIYGNTATDSIIVIKETVESVYHIDLSGHSAGDWAFVSFPIGITGSIQDVLNDATFGDGLTEWSVAKWYDGQTKTWKTYRHGSGANTLSAINNQMGVWLYLTAIGGDMTLTTGLKGYYPGAETQVQLYSGWNMVGYPSGKPLTADLALAGTGATIVSVYSSSAPYVVDHTDLGAVTMSHGNAYWIKVPSDVIWAVGT